MFSKNFRIGKRLPKNLAFGALLFCVFAAACATHGQEPQPLDSPKNISRNDLIQKYRDAKQMIYVYGSGDENAARTYEKILQAFAEKGKRFQVIVKSDEEVTEDQLKNSPIMLIGNPQNNRILQRLLPKLPFNITSNTVEFNQHQYGDHPILNIGYYPNPISPEMPLSLLTGLSDEDILNYFQEKTQNPYYWHAIDGWGYQVIDGGKRKIFGFFDESDPKQWKVGNYTHWDFSSEPTAIAAADGNTFFLHDAKVSQVQIDSITQRIAQQRASILSDFPNPQPFIPLEIHVYPSCEIKGLATGNSKPQSIVESENALNLVFHSANRGNEGESGNVLALRQLLGEASLPILEMGLSIRYTTHWQKLGWQYWAKRLFLADQAPSVADLRDPELYKHESPIYLGCFAAAFCDFLMADMGNEGFKNMYQGRSNPSKKRDDLEGKWTAYLQEMQVPQVSKMPSSSVAFMQKHLKGFNLAHEGYQIFNGYLSKEATRSLAYTATNLHSNVAAIIPYTGMGDVKKPNWMDIADGAGTENDESVVNCIWSAHASGMLAMVKPQVWPWNGWTGEVEMQSDADWELFFDRYYRWIRHYALIAEIENAELFCIGVEFSKASLQRPDDWRKMIAKIRKLYSGKITYATNWGEEFEQCHFLDALDFIGLNCYYPLSKSDKLNQKELNDGFSKTMDKVGKLAEKAGKPLVFTEIGFRSCEGAFQNPHAGPEGRPVSNETQAACYEAMVKGLENRPWFAGILLWNWPAYMEESRFDVKGFAPLGKPAEKLVEDWFLKLD